MTGVLDVPMLPAVPFAIGLFVAMLVLMEVGRQLGARRLERDPDGARAGVGAVDGAVFALLGLLIAFTFSGAASRFDSRRELVTEEANAVGTAWLRLDVLPVASQPALRDLFRRYLDARIEAYRKLPDVEAAKAGLAKSIALQQDIWQAAVAASQAPDAAPSTPILVLPTLNQMFDITTTRLMATQIHPPTVIFLMLSGVALMAALLAGDAMAVSKARSWVHVLAFAAVLPLAIYVILDIEYPRFGLIRVDAVDQVLVELRKSMK